VTDWLLSKKWRLASRKPKEIVGDSTAPPLLKTAKSSETMTVREDVIKKLKKAS
jgi:hypothetical protein